MSAGPAAMVPEPVAVDAVSPSAEALRRYTAALWSMLDSLPEGVLMVDRQGNLMLWNERFLTLWDLAPESLEHRDALRLAGELGERLQQRAALTAEMEAAVFGAAHERRADLDLADGRTFVASGAPVWLEDDLIGALVCFRDATSERRERRDLEHRALHDQLTDLPNRELFLDRLAVAVARRPRRDCAVAVAFIDLDGFKEINDSHGHAVGDAVLVTVASRLRGVVRAGDTVTRMGGDEFVVLCEEVSGDEQLEVLAGRIEAAIEQPITTDGRTLRVQASVGAVMDWDEGSEPEAILGRADAAMYDVKARRRRDD